MLGKETIQISGDSIEATLKSLIAHAGILDLRLGQPEEFERSLIKEVKFLALYEKAKWGEVERYIHKHLPELYRFSRTLAQQRR